MRFKKKFSKQEESLIKNFQQKTEQLHEDHLTIRRRRSAELRVSPRTLPELDAEGRRQQNLRKIWSLNLLKALGNGVVENKQETSIGTSTLDTSEAQQS